MKTWTPSLSAFLLLALLAGCSLFGLNESTNISATADELTVNNAVALDESFSLEAGQTQQLAPINATLKFVARVSDSRCPLGVNCFWEGEVKLQMEFSEDGGNPVPFEITGYVDPKGEAPLSVEHFGYRFTLERLDPYPEDGVVNNSPAVVTMKVERL